MRRLLTKEYIPYARVYKPRLLLILKAFGCGFYLRAASIRDNSKTNRNLNFKHFIKCARSIVSRSSFYYELSDAMLSAHLINNLKLKYLEMRSMKHFIFCTKCLYLNCILGH